VTSVISTFVDGIVDRNSVIELEVAVNSTLRLQSNPASLVKHGPPAATTLQLSPESAGSAAVRRTSASIEGDRDPQRQEQDRSAH
jgi:hypothetical protein